MSNDLQRSFADILHHAVAGLDPADRDERIAYCRAHDEHGVRMHLATDDDLIEFTWGGRTLAMVHRDVLLDDQPLPRPEFIAALPDTVEGLTHETEINRHLTDDERHLVWDLAVEVIANQTGGNREAAADALDEIASDGKLHLYGDAVNAYLQADGNVLVHITREDLARVANHPGETLHASPIEDDD
jgi:hypothetical protein